MNMCNEELNERTSAIERLRVSMVEAEMGDGTASLDFKWRDRSLELDIHFKNASATTVSDICKMAVLLITASEEGTLLVDDETRVAVTCDNKSSSVAIFGKNGEPIAFSESLEALVSRLPHAFPES